MFMRDPGRWRAAGERPLELQGRPVGGVRGGGREAPSLGMMPPPTEACHAVLVPNLWNSQRWRGATEVCRTNNT